MLEQRELIKQNTLVMMKQMYYDRQQLCQYKRPDERICLLLLSG